MSSTAQRRLKALRAQAETAGLDLIVTCTFRSLDEQARLWRCGRTLQQVQDKAAELAALWPTLGETLLAVDPVHHPRRLTNFGPGESAHNYGMAVDLMPLIHGAPVRDYKAREYQLLGELARAHGFEWGGDMRPRHYGHLQIKSFDWKDEARKDKRLIEGTS